MKQYFFLYYPTARKVDKKTIWRSNAEDREDLIKAIGEEKFNKNPKYDEFYEPSIPFCFIYIFNIFMELFNNSGEGGFNWQDINSYCQVRKINLSQTEIDYIMKCKKWASNEISKLRDDE